MSTLANKTINIGAGVRANSERHTLGIDIENQTIEDVRKMMLEIALRDVEIEENAGNTVSAVYADKGKTESIATAKKQIEVIFGDTLSKQIMVVVEQKLAEAIRETTNEISGDLVDIRSHWQWTLVKKGQPAIELGGPQDLAGVTYKDMIVLKPKVGYATTVNMLVSQTGELSVQKRKNRRSADKPKKAVGFLGFASQSVKRMSIAKNYTIWAGFSEAYPVPGEVSKYGSPYIAVKIKPHGRYRK